MPASHRYHEFRLDDPGQSALVDLLLAVAESRERFDEPVCNAMVTELTEIDVNAPVADLMPIFDRDFVAIVMDGDTFLGLITRVDLLHYLRRRADR